MGVFSSDMSKAFVSLWSPLLPEKIDACQFSKLEGLKFGAILFLSAEKQGKIVKGLMSKEAVPEDLHLDPCCRMFFRMI